MFFYVLGGLTFLKFVIKTLVVFSETFILPGTNVSVATEAFATAAHVFYYQLKWFGAGKGGWAGKQTHNSLPHAILTCRISHHWRLGWHWAGILNSTG